MPYQELFIDDAEQDLDDSYRLPASRGGIQTAERILVETEEACLGLEDLPTRGECSEGIDRSRHHKPWRMIYRTIGEDVIGDCVADGRRDTQSFLECGCCAE
ncbi:type II toxin-antitoxin system RelE/ParE family toxin [Agrobacterium salinitolerans]|uniref:Type II toxin-antitoxin system RelE/ParE family toxin n=1 Tax=Agrobacterium salinitolerans TaxID=1183413 RepID=A0A9X3KS39_9HYPH|nr:MULTISPECIES: type II toxin-antitoxin system RelE/ParE family toxin [Agrobacterium]MCZ7854690.1 type II toxin-antitoxin system RelE/ParE family toxin [Agrobacterium salinitolerans]MCZ7893909.1 type II toxin-antitoxin system RelE/ParE family toxin [Agrobacterium salinitolerans]MCZ7939860.1 type II toxin-antitoxin system RelE/ParE family toxin [Agrobacterium salinitolerans]TRA84209.1 type II toxin-antitoxin system RelE/ParE family toxin [Agrobacterium salinitolerans]